jgi:glutathione S-transferase
VLQIDDKVLGDSTDIIAELERRCPEPPLYPADADARRQALELEEHFDEHLGPHVRRAALWELIQRPEYMGMGKLGQTWFSSGVRQTYEIDDESAARSLERVHQALDLIEDTLDGRDHLVGDEFTVADLTAAALMGPALRPPELPYVAELPVPENLQRIADGIKARPAGQWIMRTYSRYRSPSAGQAARDELRPAAAVR